MKSGIFITAAVLGLALLAPPDAHGWWSYGPELNLKFSGSSFVTSSDADGSPTDAGQASTTMQSGLARAKHMRAVFSAQTQIDAALPDARCPAQTPFGGDLSTIIVVTYHDGSILQIATGADNFYCSDGSRFVSEFVGIVTGGTGRFDGASGTWEGTAEVLGSRVEATATVDLD